MQDLYKFALYSISDNGEKSNSKKQMLFNWIFKYAGERVDTIDYYRGTTQY